jgi:uncharacterized membrane protein HdeD (DUF308 family)
MAGAAALGLLLIVYLLLDGFAGISFAFVLRPTRGWIWTLINGIISHFPGAGRSFSCQLAF